jgi:hypothetical protein
MRQLQSAEYGDVSESGRKVDMLFMFDGVEVSNVEFKRPAAEKNLTSLWGGKDTSMIASNN